MASRETPCCGGDGSGPFRSDFPEGDPDSGRMEVGSLLDAFDLRHALRGTHQADPGRIPPDQKATDQFPVLHAGPVPDIDLDTYRFRVGGLVEKPFEWSYEELTSLPATTITPDIHCVTGWSKLDTKWHGVRGHEVVQRCRPKEEARFVMVQAPNDWTANLPLEDLDRNDVVFAWEYDGKPLTPKHGWPLRLVVPHLYFWKSAKWVTGLEFMDHDEPGFWEKRGYHMRGDPWKEERYHDDVRPSAGTGQGVTFPSRLRLAASV